MPCHRSQLEWQNVTVGRQESGEELLIRRGWMDMQSTWQTSLLIAWQSLAAGRIWVASYSVRIPRTIQYTFLLDWNWDVPMKINDQLVALCRVAPCNKYLQQYLSTSQTSPRDYEKSPHFCKQHFEEEGWWCFLPDSFSLSCIYQYQFKPTWLPSYKLLQSFHTQTEKLSGMQLSCMETQVSGVS